MVLAGTSMLGGVAGGTRGVPNSVTWKTVDGSTYTVTDPEVAPEDAVTITVQLFNDQSTKITLDRNDVQDVCQSPNGEMGTAVGRDIDAQQAEYGAATFDRAFFDQLGLCETGN